VKVKRSKNKNFMTSNPEYPRDIWEFIARSTERVANTRTGALLKDVLDFQALTPKGKEKMEAQHLFPKTIFPKIDPEILKPRAHSVDPDVENQIRKAQQRHAFLDVGGLKGKKDGLLGHTKGHFDVTSMEEMVSNYKSNRPKWLQPKNKEVNVTEKKVDYDRSRGISKAEQEAMMTKAVFEEARTKSERAKGLRKQFHHNIIEGKLMRVQADLKLNRVFFKPERAKLEDLDGYFANKMVDPNLDIRIIESASPTQFFEMVHRRLNPGHYHPEKFEDIVANLTPDPEDNAPVQDFQKSPYLTYLRPRHKVEVNAEPGQKVKATVSFDEDGIPWKWEYGKHHPRGGDEDRWGRRTFENIDSLAERLAGPGRKGTQCPQGLGRAMQLIRTNSTRDSPWMGGGPGPIQDRSDRVDKSQSPAPSPSHKTQLSPSPTITKSSSSMFITQKSGPI